MIDQMLSNGYVTEAQAREATAEPLVTQTRARGSQAADIPGTRNYMGAKEPAIDALIAALLEAREHPPFVSAVRALDRVLMSGFYAIPVFNVQEQWIARWNRIERPAATALTGYLPETWWHKPELQPK